MFIPNTKRFELNESTNHYERRYVLNTEVYLISIDKDKWKHTLYRTISRWFKEHPTLDAKFPYGTITKVDNISKDDVVSHRCEYCSKVLSCFRSKKRHMIKCTYKDDVSATTDISATPVTELANERTVVNNTTNNITNNNGITVNIQINSFGKENPRWLNERTLGHVFQDQVKGIASLIKAKHFNDEFPENQNIRLDTKNNMNMFLQVYQQGRWRVRQAKPVLESLLLSTQDLITDIIDTEHESDNSGDSDNDDDEQYQNKIIKEFQETEYFKDRKPRLDQKWSNVQDILSNKGKDYKKIMLSIKTAMLDRNLAENQ